MPQIFIDNTKFYYELHGKGNPLVLIAGYSCDHTFWESMISDLSKYFQVLIFDNRGVGQTSNPNPPFTIERMAEDVFSLMTSLDFFNPFIVGHSMGGAIAQILAHKYTQSIRKLILLNTSAKINLRSLFALQGLLNLLKENTSFNSIVEISMPWFFSSDYLKSQDNIKNYKSILKNNPFPPSIENLDEQLKALRQFNATDWLQDIKVPTLVVTSNEDICCLPTESVELSKKIPNAEITFIAGGHSTPIETPKIVCNEIIQFFRSQD